MKQKPDTTDLAAAIEGAAAALYCISDPFLETENRAPDRTIGAAIYGIAMFLDYISADVLDYTPGEGASQAFKDVET